MSKSNAKKLVDKISNDKKFRETLLAEEAKVALKFAKKAGLECTPEELKEISGGVLFFGIIAAIDGIKTMVSARKS